MTISLFLGATSLNPRPSEPVSMRPPARTEPFLGYYSYDIATVTGLVRHRPPRAASAPPTKAATAA